MGKYYVSIKTLNFNSVDVELFCNGRSILETIVVTRHVYKTQKYEISDKLGDLLSNKIHFLDSNYSIPPNFRKYYVLIGKMLFFIIKPERSIFTRFVYNIINKNGLIKMEEGFSWDVTWEEYKKGYKEKLMSLNIGDNNDEVLELIGSEKITQEEYFTNILWK